MTFERYTHYTLTDFLEDDSFIQWITIGDRNVSYFWQSFLENHPEKQELVSEASSIIRVYRLQKQFTNEGHREDLLKRITTTIPPQRQRTSFFRLPVYTRVAAAIAFLLVCGMALWIAQHNSHTVTTAYGEVKAVTLPDQSIVMLNGNSVITYQSTWDSSVPREVWLSGEAYFDVQHLNQDLQHVTPGDKFVVHSGNIDIHVLGTSFDVKSRHNKTNVALLSGKIEVTYAGRTKASSETLALAPGDYVVYSGQNLVTRKRLTRPHKIATWTVHEIVFTDPSLGDIMETLQDNYGYTIRSNDERLMKLKIEGEISVTTVNELLSLVSATLGIKIETSDKEIIISGK